MSSAAFFALVGAAVVASGLHGLIVGEGALRKLLCANVLGSGVFLVLVALAALTGGDQPDPVPHAMVLTGIVIAVSFTAFGAVLAVQLERARGEEEEQGSEEVGEGAER